MNRTGQVLNSVEAGRSLAWRMLATQSAAVLVVALPWLLAGRPQALAVLVGGAGLVLGTAAVAFGAFGGGLRGGGERLARLLLGVAVKWMLVAAALYLAIAVWKLPALPALVGAAVAALAVLWAARSNPRVRA